MYQHPAHPLVLQKVHKNMYQHPAHQIFPQKAVLCSPDSHNFFLDTLYEGTLCAGIYKWAQSD